MELLAPAGSKESFVAAVRGGADAVYLGVENYNARLNAPNLNLYDLEVLTAFAHEKNVKVYLALNTLIKQTELPDVAKKLSRIEAVHPDGIIVQDLGVADLIRRYYPSLSLHASTQMTVHNSAGIAELAQRGFSRAVLSRELSFAELKRIANKAPIELEVFCHGALCFSISGLCLFSSAIGSFSGNRGRCTQPCRRLWKKGTATGYLFSPKDLQLAERVPDLKEIGIKALKIEGRMRSSEYVYRVVKAYRLLIDADRNGWQTALKEAQGLLAEDYAREKTTFLFAGADTSIFTPFEAQCLGKRIGKVVSASGNSVTLTSDIELKKGDRLRITDPATDRTKTFTVNEYTDTGGTYRFSPAAERFPAGAPVFKAGDAAWDEKGIEREIDSLYRWFKKERQRIDPANIAVCRALSVETAQHAKPGNVGGDRLWVKCDDPGWLDIIAAASERTMYAVLYLTRENLHRLKAVIEAAVFPRERIAVEITPYIGEREIAEYRQAVTALLQAGVSQWFLNNLAHFRFFPAEMKKYAGPFLYVWNSAAVTALTDGGVELFATSWEDDLQNIEHMSRRSGARFLTYLFGYPPIVRSKMLAGTSCGGETIEGAGDLDFKLVFESGAGILIPCRPVTLFSQKEKLKRAGIVDFGIDLSFLSPDRLLWRTVHDAFRGTKKIPEEFSFNFRRGIR